LKPIFTPNICCSIKSKLPSAYFLIRPIITISNVKEEYSGEVRCDVADWGNWADKKIGGRKLAFDRAADVWGEDGLQGSSRRVTVCKSCYKEWKKAKKDDPNEWG
jgi:hypothetical protein